MNKVVYNACYGGFGLSNKAIELYAELSGFKLFPVKDGYMTFWFTEDPEDRTAEQMFKEKAKDFYARNLDRHDKVLVKVVEQLGKEASGECAKLQIEEISGSHYRIDEYDGAETVVEPDGYDWNVIQ